MDTIHFFASDKDLCDIFENIEKELDIKYCMEYAHTKKGIKEKPQIEFHTIGEIQKEDKGIDYLICPKAENMQTYRHILDDNSFRYETLYCDNKNSIVYKGGRKFPDMIGDYQLHIAKEYGTEFADKLFKRIVKEINKKCVKIRGLYPIFYVGNELYNNRENYVFFGMNFRFPIILTETGEVKRWWSNPNVRQFMDKSITEQLRFLQDVFSSEKWKTLHYKNWTEEYEIYEGVMYKLCINNDLSLLKDIAVLYDDNVTGKSPLVAWKTVMEELRDIAIDLAFSQKADGLKILLENLKYVPSAGYHCGCKELITILLKKKYFETFKESLFIITDETKALVKKILEDITDKRTQDQRNELIGLLMDF